MSIYAIADLHLSFAPDTDKPMDIFGARWKDHSERIRENWCSIVSEDDTVVVAGDISWGLKLSDAAYDLDWVDALPGHKVMLKGNHDLWWSGITRLNAMYDSMTFLQNDAYCVTMEDGSEVWICGSRGWLTPDDDDFTAVLFIGYCLFIGIDCSYFRFDDDINILILIVFGSSHHNIIKRFDCA